MKKSFVYLICVLLMAAMLCGGQTSSPSVSGSTGNGSGSAIESAMPSSSADA